MGHHHPDLDLSQCLLLLEHLLVHLHPTGNTRKGLPPSSAKLSTPGEGVLHSGHRLLRSRSHVAESRKYDAVFPVPAPA